MKLTTAFTSFLLASAAILLSMPIAFAAESVEMNFGKKLQLEAAAIDVASSSDGNRLFVLTDQGEIIVYSPKGDIQGRIDVGKDVDQIKAAPKGDGLFLNSRKNKTLQSVSLDFIVDIDVTGSPFKGREDAPVVVAVYTDFQ